MDNNARLIKEVLTGDQSGAWVRLVHHFGDVAYEATAGHCILRCAIVERGARRHHAGGVGGHAAPAAGGKMLMMGIRMNSNSHTCLR